MRSATDATIRGKRHNLNELARGSHRTSAVGLWWRPGGTGEELAVTARTYFIASRVWWGAALSIAPIVAAILGDPLAGVAAAAVLLLPAMIIFDTDRGWWSAEVRALPEDKERSKSELRLLTISAACGLAFGAVIAYLVG